MTPACPPSSGASFKKAFPGFVKYGRLLYGTNYVRKLEYLLNEDDFRRQRDEFVALVAFANGKRRVGRLLVAVVIGVFWWYLLGAYAASEPWNFSDARKNFMLAAVFLALVGSLIYLARWGRSAKYLQFARQYAGEIQAEVLPIGLYFKNEKGRKLLHWHELLSLCETDGNLFFQHGPGQALFIPKRVFADDGEKNEFLAEVEAGWRADPANRDSENMPRAFLGASDLQLARRRGLRKNLLAGLKLVTFQNLGTGAFQSGYWQACALTMLGLFVALLGDLGMSQPDPQFSSYGLAGFLGYVLLGILASILISVRAGNRELALPLYVIASAAGLWISIILYAVLVGARQAELEWEGAAGWIYYALFCAWWLAVYYRAVRLVHAAPPPLAFHYSSWMYFFAVMIPLYLPQQEFFYPGDSNSEPDIPQFSVEDVYYRQGELMDKALQSVAEQRPGRTDLYLLAFAGYGYEKVFTNEVDYVKDKFDRTFDTHGRSVVLGNNPATLESRPLANTHNLKRALNALAGKMNPEEDVLFLFLTSHGSQKTGVSVAMNSMDMKDVDPAALRKMLDESGIRNRVIVVSACYSGTFIEQLKAPDTLVITASASDKTSFGCGDATEFTYFGEAYFKNALSAKQSFIPAFQAARKEIAQREGREGHEASQPQIYVGEKIQARLARLEAELSAARH